MYSSNTVSHGLCQMSRPVVFGSLVRKFIYWVFMCLSSLPVSMPAPCVYLIPVEIEKSVGAPRTGVRVVVSCGWWKLIVGPLEEPAVVLYY